MIKIVLPDFPDKYEAEKRHDSSWPISGEILTNGIFHTEITHNSLAAYAKCWDVDVYFKLGPSFTIRIPQLSKVVDTRDMLMELMLADNGTADLWIRTLLGNPDADGLWAAYLEETAT